MKTFRIPNGDKCDMKDVKIQSIRMLMYANVMRGNIHAYARPLASPIKTSVWNKKKTVCILTCC